jgi:DNA-binding XRE family transcriptional regulator
MVSAFLLHYQQKGYGMKSNSLKQIRESLLMSKSELARNAGISHLTITRIEKGNPCRLETQRKILLALGLKVSDKHSVFGD